jgi:hypothetical protein
MQYHLPGSVVLDDAEAVPLSKKIMALAIDHLALGLTQLGFKLRLLTLNPCQLADHSQPLRHRSKPVARPPLPSAVGWVDTKVQVLDGLTNYLYGQVLDGDQVLLSIHFDFLPVPDFSR